MASSVLEQPSTLKRSAFRSRLSRILQSSRGTPINGSSRRRFGPLGSTTLGGSTYQGDARFRTRDLDTPVTHRSRRSEVLIERSEIEEQNIRELRGKTWRVLRMTPLYNYKTGKSDYQHYSRTLSAHIAAEAAKGTFIDASAPDDAEVGHFSGLDVGDNDPKSLLIEVKGKARNGNVQVICQAVIFSTDLSINPLKASLQSEFTYFPCMLVRGPVLYSETIQNWLEVQFDCKIISKLFTPCELAFMTAMFTGFVDEDKPLELVYSIPKEVEGLSTIEYSIKAEDCGRLWNAIKSSDIDGFSDVEATRFMHGLESNFYEIFSIKLTALSLHSINTAVAYINRQGQIKFNTKSVDGILKVLRHLTDLALDELRIV